MSRPTRNEILDELQEVQRDLRMFTVVRDTVQARISEMDHLPERRKMFVDWPVTQVVLNGLIIAIVRCEGLIEEYQKVLEQMDVPNNVVALARDTNDTGE